jgi:hypothetical protein
VLAPLHDAHEGQIVDLIAFDALLAFELTEPGGQEGRGVGVLGIEVLDQSLMVEDQPPGIVGDEPELDKEQTGVAADTAHAAGFGKVGLNGSDA